MTDEELDAMPVLSEADECWEHELRLRDQERRLRARGLLARMRMALYRAFEDEVATDEEPEWFREVFEASEQRAMEAGR